MTRNIHFQVGAVLNRQVKCMIDMCHALVPHTRARGGNSNVPVLLRDSLAFSRHILDVMFGCFGCSLPRDIAGYNGFVI